MNQKISLKGLAVWLVCMVFFLYEFLLRTLLGTFQTAIMHDIHLTPLKFAFLSSTAYTLIYGLMQIPVGNIIKKFDLKKALLFACLVCTIANFGFAYAQGFYSALIFRALMGLGSSFGFICLLVAIYDWLPYQNVALYIGLSQFFGTLGPMATGAPLTMLAQSSFITWRTIFVLLSVMGIILSVLVLLIVESNKKNDGTFLVLNTKQPISRNLWLAIKDYRIWIIAITAAFIYFSLEYLSENEGKAFLMTKGFSAGFASYMISIAWLGFALGSPLAGFISDRISRRKPILICSATMHFLALTSIIYLPLNAAQMTLAFLVFGMGVGSASIAIVIMGEQFKLKEVSSGLAFNNGFTMLFVSIMAPILGSLLTAISHHKYHTLVMYQETFVILSILPFVALLLTFFGIKETFGRSTKEHVVLNFKS